MSGKSKGKNDDSGRRRHGDKKRAVARIRCAGLEVDVPPELDLPAGVPMAAAPKERRSPEVPSDVREFLKPMAAVATCAWRARAKMVDPETGEPLEEMRRVYRFVEGIFSALAEAGLRVLDPKGRTYDSGMALKVLGFEPTPGLGREEIIETIRPSVVWHDRLLQMGEVIVGTPATAGRSETASAEESSEDMPTEDTETASAAPSGRSDSAPGGANDEPVSSRSEGENHEQDDD
jgi:hypothetical protein